MTAPHDLRRRIEEVYRQRTDSTSAHGALSWFADQAHVHRQTVTRWVQGEREPQGPAIGLLECLEREVGSPVREHSEGGRGAAGSE